MVTLTITKVVNHGQFLQTFASDGKREVSYCHNSLPFTEAGVLNALMCQYLAPPYVEPEHKGPKERVEIPVETGPCTGPDPVSNLRVLKVRTLENEYKIIRGPLSITFEEEVKDDKSDSSSGNSRSGLASGGVPS